MIPVIKEKTKIDRKLRLFAWLLSYVAVSVLSFFAGWYASALLSAPGLRFDNGAEESQYAQGFSDFVAMWNSYIVEQDGYIPVDPYRGLIEAEKVASYDALRGIVFEPFLPPRINPNLAANGKRIVFWLPRPDLRQIWVCYADGTWNRGTTLPRTVKESIESQYDLAAVGYPQWKTLKEKAKWIAENRNRLVWDPTRRMYVPPGQ